MGGKDTPPLSVSVSPLQTHGFMTEKTRSFSMSSATSSSSSLSSTSTSSSGSGYHQPSPIRYVPPCKTRVNLAMQQCPSPSITRVDRADSVESKDGTLSPIRAYIDCITPQTLKCAIVGDSGVGKTSLLMSYVVDKFPDTHSPTIYDKFSSEYNSYTYANNTLGIIATLVLKLSCIELYMYNSDLFSLSLYSLQLQSQSMERE